MQHITPKIKIDDKELVFSSDLFVKNNQLVSIEIPVKNDLLKMSLTFEEGKDGESATGSWTADNDIVRFVFKGWTNPLGSCILEPTKFGDLANGQKLYFQITHHYVSNLNLVHLFLFAGA